MGYYGTSGGAFGGKAKPVKTYKPVPLSSGSGQLDLNDYETEVQSDPGKFTIDLTNLGPSIADTAGSAIEFGSNLLGGVAGALGSIGPDGEDASLGQLAEDV